MAKLKLTFIWITETTQDQCGNIPFRETLMNLCSNYVSGRYITLLIATKKYEVHLKLEQLEDDKLELNNSAWINKNVGTILISINLF